MKDKRLLRLIIIAGLIFTFVTVTSLFAGGNKDLGNKLNECNGKVENLNTENDNLKSQVNDLQTQISSLKSEKQQLEAKIKNLEAEITQKDKEIADLKAKQEAPEPSIVSKTVEQQIQDKNSQIQALQLKKQKLEQNFQQVNQQLAQLQQENQTLKSQNNVLVSEKKSLEEKVSKISQEKKDTEKALSVYEGIQKRSQKMMDIALEKIKSVLKDEIAKGEVRVFKGTMGIVLDVKGEPMFNKGSVKLNPNGRYVIGKIGLLLEELDGYMIGVIGNADNKPIVTRSIKKCYPSNWELSAGRGATVVRYITKHNTVPPTRMVAMGLGEFQPIDTNSTVEGRGNNRRVDIVLLPMDVLASVVVGAEIR